MCGSRTGVGARAVGMLLATLLLGIVLGVLGAGALANARADRLAGARGEGGFVSHMESILQPTPEQAEILRPILEGYEARNREIMRSANEGLRSTLESMEAELDSLLTPEQARRLRDFVRRPPPGAGGRGPDGPRRPGPGNRPPPR